jgi:hypothetical protein
MKQVDVQHGAAADSRLSLTCKAKQQRHCWWLTGFRKHSSRSALHLQLLLTLFVLWQCNATSYRRLSMSTVRIAMRQVVSMYIACQHLCFTNPNTIIYNNSIYCTVQLTGVSTQLLLQSSADNLMEADARAFCFARPTLSSHNLGCCAAAAAQFLAPSCG